MNGFEVANRYIRALLAVGGDGTGGESVDGCEVANRYIRALLLSVGMVLVMKVSQPAGYWAGHMGGKYCVVMIMKQNSLIREQMMITVIH